MLPPRTHLNLETLVGEISRYVPQVLSHHNPASNEFSSARLPSLGPCMSVHTRGMLFLKFGKTAAATARDSCSEHLSTSGGGLVKLFELSVLTKGCKMPARGFNFLGMLSAKFLGLRV